MAIPIQGARSLTEGWDRFRAAIEKTHGRLPPRLAEAHQDAFWAGAATLWDIVMHAPEMDPGDTDDTAGQQLLEQLQGELEGYVSERVAILFPLKGKPS